MQLNSQLETENELNAILKWRRDTWLIIWRNKNIKFNEISRWTLELLLRCSSAWKIVADVNFSDVQDDTAKPSSTHISPFPLYTYLFFPRLFYKWIVDLFTLHQFFVVAGYHFRKVVLVDIEYHGIYPTQSAYLFGACYELKQLYLVDCSSVIMWWMLLIGCWFWHSEVSD